MDNVPPISSLKSFLPGSVASTSVRDSTDDKNDSALSPFVPQLSFEGVGTYDPSVGVPLGAAERHWRDADEKTKAFEYWVMGLGIDPKTDARRTFTVGNTRVTYRVKDEVRDIRCEEDGPEGTTYTGLKDQWIRDGYDVITHREPSQMVSICYHIPATKTGENTRVGLQWVSPYMSNDVLPFRPSVTDRKHLVVSSAVLDPLASKCHSDDSLNLQKLKIATPLARSRPDYPLSAQSTARTRTVDTIISEGF